MSAASQIQSSFVNRLPREIRNAIYLELWRSSGLRQHIILHGPWDDQHFCRWRCSKEFEVQDELQQDIEDLRIQLQVTMGEDLTKYQHERVSLYCRRLQSPWMNHWLCGEQAYEKHGLEAVWGDTTSTLKCWKEDGNIEQVRRWSSPYIPMLLSCRLVSAECLQSIYEATTFIFTDLRTLQMFFGYCELHPETKAIPKLSITPPAFFKYTRSLEFSLSPDFPKLLLCANFDLPGIEHRHEVYDFHWMRLNRFENIESVNVWISSRALTCRVDSDDDDLFRGIKEFGANEIKELLAPFKHIRSFALSTPLGSSVGPQEGIVEGVVPSRGRLYKRGSGDKFHPFLTMIQHGNFFDGLIYTSTTGEVRLARNGGDHDLMKEA